MKSLDNLKYLLCDELEKIAVKGELTAGSLETVHKLTDTIKNIGKIEMFYSGDDYGQDGYSRAGEWEARGRFGRGEYDEGGSSYARRGQHYVRGHHSREDGMGGGMRETRARYSRGDGKDHMLHELGKMMEDADEHERRIIERAMQEIRKA